MTAHDRVGVHVITGGFPPGSTAGHDMDYARLRLLELMSERPELQTTTANDYTDISKWLPTTKLVISYVAGPYPDTEQNAALRRWLESGGRWFALHGTSGGRAARLEENSRRRAMVKLDHHDTLGGFFLNHPPLRRFRVDVTNGSPLTAGLGDHFETMDELYLIELQHPDTTDVILTTQLAEDPSPEGFGFAYDDDTSVGADGKTRVLGYSRTVGDGGVAYVALGHCHNPMTNSQPYVDESVDPAGQTPMTFRGSWETEEFTTILRNAITWGTTA